MQCSVDQLALLSLFYNLSSSFLLLFFFFYLTSILLARFFFYIGSNPFRNHDGFEHAVLSEEEEEEEGFYQEESCREKFYLDSDTIHESETPSLVQDSSTRSGNSLRRRDQFLSEELVRGTHGDEFTKEQTNNGNFGNQRLSVYRSPRTSNSEVRRHDDDVDDDEEVGDEEIRAEDTDSAYDDSETNYDNVINGPSSTIIRNPNQHGFVNNHIINDDVTHDDENFKFEESEGEKMKSNFTHDDEFLIFSPPRSQSKKFQQVQLMKHHEEISQDSCTVGSTSKSSSEWRSSINFKDSGTEDPFSSSSRRSCPKWESYTVFQKYDEEMLFLDRISAQKLHETESLKSIQACPRSISERIVHKLATRSNKSDFRRNPYYELEAAYVAQICLTWEALNWNYKYFQRLKASRRESDTGCPAYVAQQFQQFQVLLQRYIENEPYEHGRRPEIYARMRKLAPNLLQVPEYRDSSDEKREEGRGSRIPSDSFLEMMEESIRTFMNFLKADRENHYQMLVALFKRKRRGLVDPTHLQVVKKANKKNKMRVKDLRRAQNCLRRRRLKEEEEMEILMALIDLKVVSRVLRTSELSEEQLRWCEDKMSKVKVVDGKKLRRDSSPLFFPAH